MLLKIVMLKSNGISYFKNLFSRAKNNPSTKHISVPMPQAEDIIKELHVAYDLAIINALQKLSSRFAEKSNIKVAYKIELAVCELQDHFGRKF